MNAPLISVIIPVYNHADELIACVDSLQKQTLASYEVIFVDDGSTDCSFEVIQTLVKRFAKSRSVRQSNRGAPAARNAGAALAQAPFLLFLDADVTLQPQALQSWYHALQQHPDCAFAYSAYYFGWKLMKGVSFDNELLKRFNYIHTTSLLRTEYFPGFDESLKKFQDWDLWLTIAQQGGTGCLVDAPLFSIKPRKEGMSSWLPSFAYRLPWKSMRIMPKRIRAYNHAAAVIRKKHHLPYET